jgi:hypothetical protein
MPCGKFTRSVWIDVETVEVSLFQAAKLERGCERGTESGPEQSVDPAPGQPLTETKRDYNHRAAQMDKQQCLPPVWIASLQYDSFLGAQPWLSALGFSI